MLIKLNINDRAALAIKNKTKKVEIRANKKNSEYDYSKINTNDIIEFNSNSLGMCAERNAIANMITNGENEILKLVCIDGKGNVGFPCGACREYLMQLSKNSKKLEILKDINTKETIKLQTLIPNWWGYDRV